MKNLAPAFQFYASDYLADAEVQMLTLEEEGAYIRLLAYCWREESIPADPEAAARLCKGCSTAVVTVVQGLFIKKPDDPSRLIHKRLEEERKKQEEYRKQRAEAGRKSAEKRSTSVGTRAQHPLNENSTLQSSSSSSASELAGLEIKKAEGPESDPSIDVTPRPSNGRAPGPSDVVQEIYRHYPVKVNDNDALAAIEASLQHIAAPALLEAVKAYATEVKKTNTQRPTWPATWFREMRWKTYAPIDPVPEETISVHMKDDQDFSTFPKEFYQP